MSILIQQLEDLIKQNHMLAHPFYQAWSCGELLKTTLQQYAKEYYYHVRAFPRYLSALHSRCENPEVRKHLLENLIDEEVGSPNHPDLWKSFAEALGVPMEELGTKKPELATQKVIDHFFTCCRTLPISAGIAALYSYESQIPAICQTKIQGLRNWYGLSDPKEYRYFTVHESVDVAHSQIEKAMFEKIVASEEEEVVIETVKKTVCCLWDFLTSFLTTPCSAFSCESRQNV